MAATTPTAAAAISTTATTPSAAAAILTTATTPTATVAALLGEQDSQVPEPVEHDRTFHQRSYGEQFCRRADMTSDGSRMLEVVDHASGHLAAGFLSSNASYILQTQGGDHVGIDMPPHEQVPAREPPAPVELIRALWSMSLMTLVPAISTALYKPARGVVFGQNKLSYYLVLSVIVASGLGEAFTAFWLSRPGSGSQHRLTFGRAVLCASVLPFAAVLGIAGYGFIQG